MTRALILVAVVFLVVGVAFAGYDFLAARIGAPSILAAFYSLWRDTTSGLGAAVMGNKAWIIAIIAGFSILWLIARLPSTKRSKGRVGRD